MTKKVILAVVVFAISIICGSSIVFASENTTTLGNEVNRSMEKTESETSNMTKSGETGTDNVGESVKNGVEDVGNSIKDGVEDIGDELGTDEDTNNAVVGTTRNYEAAQTADTTGNGMTGTTWVWMILAVVAIIIIAAVWYYVAQNN